MGIRRLPVIHFVFIYSMSTNHQPSLEVGLAGRVVVVSVVSIIVLDSQHIVVKVRVHKGNGHFVLQQSSALTIRSIAHVTHSVVGQAASRLYFVVSVRAGVGVNTLQVSDCLPSFARVQTTPILTGPKAFKKIKVIFMSTPQLKTNNDIYRSICELL